MAYPGQYAIRQLGCRATGVQRHGRSGKLAALFTTSFYIELDGASLCIGHSGLNSGPLNILIDVPVSVDWRQSGLRFGDKVWTTPGNIRIGQRLKISTEQPHIWHPPAIDRGWTAASLRAGLNSLSDYDKDDIPNEGLGRFIRSDRPSFPSHPVSDYAEPTIGAFRSWLAGNTKETAWLESLIGLGPGLTPSGDDFIGGAMIALHTLGETAFADRIWHIACPLSLSAGNRISHAHLEAAAAGYGSAELHDAIIALIHARPALLRDAIRDLDRIGHTSGWDSLAGAVTACRAYLSALDPECRTQPAPDLVEAFPR